MIFKRISYTLPNSSIHYFGGASCVDGDNLIMTTRNITNQSRLTLYKLTPDSFYQSPCINLIKADIFENFHTSILKDSLGQSYPFVFHLNGQKYLVFTDWYRDKETNRISNRLTLSSVNDNYSPTQIHIFKYGILSNSGACRIYYNHPFIEIFIPIFCDSNPDLFPNYHINCAKFKVNSLTSFANLAEQISVQSLTSIRTNYDKNTCFTKISNEIKSFIFAARNNSSKYCLYTCNLSDNFQLENLSKLSYDANLDLSYPMTCDILDTRYLIASSGRYGSEGLLISRL